VGLPLGLYKLILSEACGERSRTVEGLALFFHGPKTEKFSYSFYIKELTIILTLQKLALFCIKIGRFVEHSRQL